MYIVHGDEISRPSIIIMPLNRYPFTFISHMYLTGTPTFFKKQPYEKSLTSDRYKTDPGYKQA